MKKIASILLFALTAVVMLFAFTACADPALKEVAGTYEMTEISGTVSGISVTKDMYDYYRIILDEKGNAVVESKAKGGASYKAEGTYKYEDGKIKLITKSIVGNVTEEMDYADGVITYTVNMSEMKFTLTLTRVTETEGEE